MSSERFDHHMSDADALDVEHGEGPDTAIDDRDRRRARPQPRLGPLRRQDRAGQPSDSSAPAACGHAAASSRAAALVGRRALRPQLSPAPRAHAPEPATFETVLDLARNAAMESFDRARPLWEYTLVDGLADGRAAAIMKVHHSMTDGVGGMRLAMMLFDLDRDGDDPGPLPDATDLQVISRIDVVRRSLWHRIRRAEGIVIRGAARLRVTDPTVRAPSGRLRRRGCRRGPVDREVPGARDDAALVDHPRRARWRVGWRSSRCHSTI